ncbi:MAG: tetratricopeptide repeat protein, partial [Campylobacterales bacterium]|nr:tetratricopeptide repeat protein [Campylobacterales bacterium]
MRVVFLLLIFTFSFVSGAGLSMNTYKKLDKIQKQIANKEYKKSKEDLRDLLERINNKVDKSYILQTLGSIYLAQDDYQQAIKIYKQALDLNKFPKETISQTN